MTTARLFTGSASSWAALMPHLPGAGPYHAMAWGQIVAQAFGGAFAIYEVEGARGKTYMPVLSGGSMAASGFVSGAIGYGGALAASPTPLTTVEQLATARQLEDHLGLPCLRLVTAPQHQSTSGRLTRIVALPDCALALAQHVSGNVRTSRRKALASGLSVQRLDASDAPALAQLIQATQQRVDSPYQTPTALVERLLQPEHADLVLPLGCWLDGKLVCGGVFLYANGYVAYLFNGWDRDYATLCPNYLLVFEAMQQAIARGARAFDLGYSHAASLDAFKQRWNTVPAYYDAIFPSGDKQ